MKTTVAMALLGAVIGFVAGSKWHAPADDPDASRKVVEKSERRIEVHRTPAGGRSDRGTANEPRQLIQNARHAGVILDGVARARLIEEILELPAGAFPEVLNSLKQIKGDNAHDPFSVRIPEFLAVGLARWYELEGASVLDWVLSQPDELEMDGPPIDSWGMVQTLILDGFASEPGRALDLMKRYHALCQAAGNSSGIEVSSFLQMEGWDDLEVIRDQAPFRIWTEISKQFKDHAVSNLVNYESVWFAKVSEKERQLFQRFGVAEEVARQVEAANQESHRKFARLLEGSE